MGIPAETRRRRPVVEPIEQPRFPVRGAYPVDSAETNPATQKIPQAPAPERPGFFKENIVRHCFALGGFSAGFLCYISGKPALFWILPTVVAGAAELGAVIARFANRPNFIPPDDRR